MAEDQLIDTWKIHSRIVLYLLDAIPPDALGGVSASKGRSVGQMFAHLHNNRLMWLEAAAPELMKGCSKIEKEKADHKKRLQSSLEASARAVEALLKKGIESGRIKAFKPHPTAFLAYLISHEAYHHGEIGMTLTQAGHPLDKKISYGIWEWGVR